ncbi:MAG: LLM class flavin-dependent oxidoreductase [Actinomycetota bacterium]
MDLGICFHREEPAASVVGRARQAEALGFDEFWVIEDCFYTTGVTLAAAALTATSEIDVGIGIMPVVARNPAITAMEIATLAELAPGRLQAGLGHGVQFWMEQMSARVASPLTVLEETFTAVRGLLEGEELTVEGRYVSLDKVALHTPPSVVPPLLAGVRGPKSMEIAARCGDGVVLADFVGADYVRQVREQLSAAGGRDDHRVTVFASVAAAPTEDVAAGIRHEVAYFLAEVAGMAPASLQAVAWWDEFEARAGEVGWVEAAQALSPQQWNDISGVGTIDGAHAYVESLRDAGADAVCFFPNPDEPTPDTDGIASWLLA